MRAFVINLERSTARREFMRKQLSQQEVSFEFVQAVDGSKLSDEYLAQICDFEQLAKRPYLLRRGVYGCLLSHYSIYQKIVAENLPYALVMEDDIELQPGLRALLTALELKLQVNEVVLLFTQNNYMPTIFSSQQAEKLPGHHQLSYPIDPWALGSAAGYVITREAAQRMLDFMLPIRFAADTWGAFYTEKAIASMRCVTPFMVKPAGFKSDIDYVSTDSLKGKLLALVNKYNIFPFKQILNYRRKNLLDKTIEYSFTSEVSLVSVATIQPAQQSG